MRKADNPNNRFENLLKESIDFYLSATIIRDKLTGVHYMYTQGGQSGGLTPLLDKEGKPIIEL